MSNSPTLYAFFLRVEDRLIKTVMDIASDEKWIETIRKATNSDSEVILVREGSWNAPKVSSLDDNEIQNCQDAIISAIQRAKPHVFLQISIEDIRRHMGWLTSAATGLLVVIVSHIDKLAESSTTPPTCEICKSEPGDQYSFYFGKKMSESAKYVGSRTKQVTTTYADLRSMQVTICRKCFDRKARPHLISEMLFATFSTLVIGGILAFVFVGGLFGQSLIGLLGVVGLSLIVFIAGLRNVIRHSTNKDYRDEYFNQHQHFGSRLALNLHKSKLTELGYDSFFTSIEYQALFGDRGKSQLN